jgi:tetratricopeptide (TPR) repeat protein
MEAGLARLERVIELFEEEASDSTSRAWAHYWRARFYQRMGRLDEAKQEFGIVLQLSPDFFQSPSFDHARRPPIER